MRFHDLAIDRPDEGRQLAGDRQGSWPDSPATLQSIPGECLRFTDQLAHSGAQLHALFRVAAMTKISVALAYGCSGASSASMFWRAGRYEFFPRGPAEPNVLFSQLRP
jgi:hypothetical protein